MSTVSSLISLCYLSFSPFLPAWLGVWTQRTAGQGPGAEVVTAAVGQTATLTAPVTVGIFSFSWYRGTAAVDAQRILTYVVSSSVQTNGSQYTGLETPLPDGSLRIRDLTTRYSGDYTVNVIDINGKPTPATRRLRVYENLSQPSLVMTSGLDFNGYIMTVKCEALSQTVERYLFLKDNVNLTCDQQRITCTESSPFLHFHPIMTSDSGTYTCGIYNAVSSSTSRPLEIRVKDPISNVIISSNVTSGHLWENEGSVNLTCSALGTDPIFSWTFNGSALPQDPRYHLSPDGSSLVISPLTRRDTGPFVCTASNPANNQSSQPFLLPISWRPSGGIQCGAQNVSDSHVELLCSWPGGSPPASVQLQLPPSINANESNEVMHSVPRSDISPNMTLTCRGAQEGYTDSCSLTLGLPQDSGFKDNTTLPVTGGQPVVLVVNLVSRSSSRVSSAGVLPAIFSWFNGTSSVGSGGRVEITSNASFSQMVIASAMESDSGDYICRAENLMGATIFSFRVHVSPAPETSTTITMTTPPVTRPNDNAGGLSGGAIAGIVVGVLAVVVIVGVTVYCVVKKKKDKVPRSENRSNAGRPQEDGSLYSKVLEKVGEKAAPYYVNVDTRPAEPRYETISPIPAEPRYETFFPKTV